MITSMFRRSIGRPSRCVLDPISRVVRSRAGVLRQHDVRPPADHMLHSRFMEQLDVRSMDKHSGPRLDPVQRNAFESASPPSPIPSGGSFSARGGDLGGTAENLESFPTLLWTWTLPPCPSTMDLIPARTNQNPYPCFCAFLHIVYILSSGPFLFNPPFGPGQ